MRKILLLLVSSIIYLVSIAQVEIKFTLSGSDSIFYEVRGDGNEVLFLAGGPGGSSKSLSSIVDYVSRDNKTILLHQRGTGLSSYNKVDSSTITLNQYIEDINNLLIKEKIDSAIYIIGHSWGAMLALDYAVKNPTKLKGLVLIGSPGYSLDFVQAMNNEIFSRMTASEMDSLKLYFGQLNSGKYLAEKDQILEKVGALTVSKQFYNPILAKELEKYGSLNSKINSLMMGDLKNEKWNVLNGIKMLDIPIVIINGSYDPIPRIFVERMNESLPNGELYFIENCGHYVWIEKPEELRQIIESFLERY